MPKPTQEQLLTALPEPDHQEDDTYAWFALINETEAARFLGVSVRSMQGFRYRGGGPRFVRISSRCIKYRRIDLRAWSEHLLRTGTSDHSMAQD